MTILYPTLQCGVIKDFEQQKLGHILEIKGKVVKNFPVETILKNFDTISEILGSSYQAI